MVGKRAKISPPGGSGCDAVLADVVNLVEAARSAATRSVNAVMTATYWAIGRNIVEEEQRGAARAGYGDQLVINLSRDLQARFGRGFGRANLFQMKAFFLAYRDIVQTESGLSDGEGPVKIVQTLTGQSGTAIGLAALAARFKLPLSHYVRLLSVPNTEGWRHQQARRRFHTGFRFRSSWPNRSLLLDAIGIPYSCLIAPGHSALKRGFRFHSIRPIPSLESDLHRCALVAGSGVAHEKCPFGCPQRTAWRYSSFASMRRFFWRPSSVSLGAMGRSSPKPTASSRFLSMPFDTM
jgi:DUF1016 N-terminal domain